MALPTWIPDALRSERAPYKAIVWRCVEAQHVVSTLALVDTLDEQSVLEDVLEESKPPIPAACEGLHYLYMTPFRYGLYPTGSRFRRAGATPGVYYASETAETAVAETAFHLLLFYAESPATPFPRKPSEHTAFDVPVRTEASIDLTRKPFRAESALWTDPLAYEPCQQLGEMARAAGVELLRYTSVRDPAQKANVALLTCRAFATKAPTRRHTWRLWLNRAGVHVLRDVDGRKLSLPPETWANDRRLDTLQQFTG